MKHFTIAYRDEDNNFLEICEYAEKSDEAIKNAIKDIPFLKNNQNYIFRCTNESDLDWLMNMEGFKQKEWDKDSLYEESLYLIKGIKSHLNHIFHWLHKSLQN